MVKIFCFEFLFLTTTGTEEIGSCEKGGGRGMKGGKVGGREVFEF